ncbi:MAG: phosphoribosylformylglycinamidine synthase [Betaproteobacteria bacterium]|nr:phosphoribosylformylglycinamidine synthase [Betaproteobacteria bacterium]
MSDILLLPGPLALSPFRLDKLNTQLDAAGLNTASGQVAGARYIHFAKLARTLSVREREVLDRLLQYGAPWRDEHARSRMVLVVPRLGTISPWSSKATDIAHNCGLGVVERMERGVAYYLEQEGLVHVAGVLHDRMTESVLFSLDDAAKLFHQVAPKPLATIPILAGGRGALERVNKTLGLALADDEMDYLVAYFSGIGRDPTDVEVTMFAQANSEHCRHKIFNASWVVDDETKDTTLFQMIRTTHAANSRGTVSAYSDNAAVIEGREVARFFAGEGGQFGYADDLTHTLIKVETHNHPTAIAPFPGAATGSGGEIRDEGATGRGAKPKAGLVGFSVSNLRIPGLNEPWESPVNSPDRIASPLAIMLDGPIGAASFNNEFGRPNLNGYFRTFEANVDGVVRGYHKPIMIAGGLGNVRGSHATKGPFPPGTLFIQLGGPGMLIGMGGGAASSMTAGSNTADLDFDSVQRGNPELQRRAQEVIDRCWALGDLNPILSIHDVGAGGLSNALPELAHSGGQGARFELRAPANEEPGMTPREVWSNEAQERYVLAIAPSNLTLFQRLCERERCPFAVVGEATAGATLVVTDAQFGNRAVDMSMAALLGKPPRMLRDVKRVARTLPALDLDAMDLKEACLRVMRAPTVASKNFLITIGDRTVGGLCARDQLVGPWQVAVADCAATLLSFQGYAGEAFAMGERTPLAVLNPVTSGRMAIGEALTNIAAAPVVLPLVKLSANWMAAAGFPGEDAALFDTVKAVAVDLCQALGVAIPVGKDSLSMRTAWEDAAGKHEVVAPLSLIVSAFAPCDDVRAVWTPVLARGATDLVLIDLAGGRQRLGGSMLAQVFNQMGNETPDLDDPQIVKRFFAAMAELRVTGAVLAYHDRSDGGLFATVCEMAFAGHVGVTLNVDLLAFDAQAVDVDGAERRPPLGRDAAKVLAALFAEELGAVIQIAAARRLEVLGVLRRHGVAAQVVGNVNDRDEIRIVRNAKAIFAMPRPALQRIWSDVSLRMQGLRDNPQAALDEAARIEDADDAGLSVQVTFSITDDVAAPYIARGGRPPVAILREQGVNGQVEMAAAFDRAGFAAHDVHMTDILSGRITLDRFVAVVACGGFSYGDVLGAGAGWAKSILFNARARDQLAGFFERRDTIGLGICNGCQMMSHLSAMIPGAQAWPRFERNASEQFEARLVMVEVAASPSVFFRGMAGSRMPVAMAHGEGRAEFKDANARANALVALRYVDHLGAATERYPYNPGGSPDGVTGLTTTDGRFTIAMPHPERVFRSVQLSWHPADWGEDSPWMRMFRNARVAIG